MVRFAPETLMRPRWLLGYAKTGRAPDLTVPNMAVRGEPVDIGANAGKCCIAAFNAIQRPRRGLSDEA